MKKPHATPCAIAREFRADEMFFSTTDTRGVITAGNDVFARVSGYPANELIGHAHNIIRHPDMPRAAFRLVWSYLEQSRRAAALVKNLARDGCFYWVVALFVPVPGGFLSIRFKPTSTLVADFARIYAIMLAEEERQLAAGAAESAAMDASSALLHDAVHARGFADYDAFMRALLCDELKSRDAVLAREGRTIISPLPAETADGAISARLRTLYRRFDDTYVQLSRLFTRLDEFVSLRGILEGKASFVEKLARELRLAAMNSALASARVGSEGLSISVVSQHMGTSSACVAGSVDLLTTGIRGVSGRLRSVIFNLATARLQIEMTMIYLHELIAPRAGAETDPASPRLIKTLQHALRDSLARATAALGDLESGTRGLGSTSHSLGRHMLELQVAQLCGVVESTRLHENAGFTAVFAHIRQLVDETRGQLSELGQALAQLDAIAAETPATARAIETSVVAMEPEIAVLAG